MPGQRHQQTEPRQIAADSGIQQRIQPQQATGANTGACCTAPLPRPGSAAPPKPSGKTLCQALRELAAFENQKGTQRFIKDIIDRDTLFRGNLVINHHPVTGGGNPADPVIEDTEFKDPRLPHYVDMEYVEVGYALTRQGLNAQSTYIAWVGAKKLISGIGGIAQELGYNGLPSTASTGISHPPNLVGLRIGELIAKRYRNITHFADEFCKGGG